MYVRTLNELLLVHRRYVGKQIIIIVIDIVKVVSGIDFMVLVGRTS